jgi:hypothetical protein
MVELQESSAHHAKRKKMIMIMINMTMMTTKIVI